MQWLCCRVARSFSVKLIHLSRLPIRGPGALGASVFLGPTSRNLPMSICLGIEWTDASNKPAK